MAVIFMIWMVLVTIFNCCMARAMDATAAIDGKEKKWDENVTIVPRPSKEKTKMNIPLVIGVIGGVIGLFIIIILCIIFYVHKRKLAALRALASAKSKEKSPKSISGPYIMVDNLDSTIDAKDDQLPSKTATPEKEAVPVEVKKKNDAKIPAILPPTAGKKSSSARPCKKSPVVIAPIKKSPAAPVKKSPAVNSDSRLSKSEFSIPTAKKAPSPSSPDKKSASVSAPRSISMKSPASSKTEGVGVSAEIDISTRESSSHPMGSVSFKVPYNEMVPKKM